MIFIKPTPLYTTQYPDLFITYTHDKFLFPALNSLNNFDIIDYEAQLIQLIFTLNIQLTTYSEACLLLKSILFILFAKLNAPNS